MLLSNTVVLHGEVSQMAQGPIEYLRSKWNYYDIMGICALYTMALAYFNHDLSLMRSCGAVGLLANSISILKLLRPFESTGLVIRMVETAVPEMYGFIVVNIVLLWGFAISLSVATEQDHEWDAEETGNVPASLFATFIALLGTFDSAKFDYALSGVIFTLFAFSMIIVMLNLLIAIMSKSCVAPCTCSTRLTRCVRPASVPDVVA
jgi:hypothetical protein